MARRIRGSWLALLLGLMTFLGSPAAAFAESGDAADSIADHLAVGEFAPARRIAETIEDPTERDAQLAVVAQSQGMAGGHALSLATIGLLSDDRARAAALASFAEQPGAPRAALGGVQADFDGLMDLITSTVAPTTWDLVGGNGSIAPFESGVRADAAGVLRRVARKPGMRLTALVKAEQARQIGEEEFHSADARRPSPLRKISLPRLERAVQLRLAAGQVLTEEMQFLAGLEKIRYVLVYPQSGDLVLAGPAGDWKPGPEGRTVSCSSGRPVVRLDDFIVTLRQLRANSGATFGCSITPTTEGLARTRAFVESHRGTPLKPADRDRWISRLRSQLGRQTIDVFGIDPGTRVAQVLVEADYRMKLVGMGLEEGTVGVESYLDSIHLAKDQAPPPMDVLRWWFTMNYKSLFTTEDRDGFELRGQGVQVQCENELLDDKGTRIHTGQASDLNQAFAQSFTEYFTVLARKYPVYADLQNVFDLALVVALICSEGLADRVHWHALCFGDERVYRVPLAPPAKEVETVINHRVVNDRHVIVGVSGGVRVDPWSIVARSAIAADTYGKLKAERVAGLAKKDLEADSWWWD